LVWGILFLLQKLAFGGIVLGEVAIIIPMVILFFVTFYIYNKKVI
jgi:hypothetical protein